MRKIDLTETLNGYGFRTIEGIRSYYSKAVEDANGKVLIRIGEWNVVMVKVGHKYGVEGMSKWKPDTNTKN
jgi:hypothetical protein